MQTECRSSFAVLSDVQYAAITFTGTKYRNPLICALPTD